MTLWLGLGLEFGLGAVLGLGLELWLGMLETLLEASKQIAALLETLKQV